MFDLLSHAPRPAIAAVLLATATLAACGTAEEPGAEPSASTIALLDGVAVTTVDVVKAADEPVMALATRAGDDGAAYLALRSGRVVRIASPRPGAPVEVSEPLLDFSQDVSQGAERGMLGLTFSPDGGRLYTSYTNRAGASALDEYAMVGTGPATTIPRGTRRPILRVARTEDFHNGGNVVFGPDRSLYMALGEGGGASVGDDHAQDPTSLLGKIIRIKPTDGRPAYRVPAGNPYAGVAEARPEIWISGVRNPWRFSFDRATGDLWIADVGEQQQEEIDFLPAGPAGGGAGKGANLGWAQMEGDQPYDGGTPPPDHVAPLFTYAHEDGGCAVIGGYVYRGPDFPDLVGAYLFVDRCQLRLRALVQQGGEVVEVADLGEMPEGTVSFGEDTDGRLYLLQQSGDVLRLAPPPP